MNTQAPLKQTERQFETAVAEYAELQGWLSYHTFDSRRSTPGFPDRVFVRDDRLIFVEFKADTGRVSRAQEMWLGALREVAYAVHRVTEQWLVRVVVWRPADWALIERELAR